MKIYQIYKKSHGCSRQKFICSTKYESQAVMLIRRLGKKFIVIEKETEE